VVINFNECSSVFSQASIVLLGFSILLAIFAGFRVYINESSEIKSKPFLREIMGGLDVFFTGRFLNESGRKWRLPYVCAVGYIICWVIYSYFFSIC
jgi:hypothetical protein